MSKSHRLAWAAGFIDGDGFITIQDRKTKYKDKVYTGHYVRLGCCQASETPLKELQTLFGGSIKVKNSGPNREGYNRKTQYVWNVSTQQASDALTQLLPYLVHKKDVAEIALEFQATMGTGIISEDLYQKRTQLQDKVKYLNSLS